MKISEGTVHNLPEDIKNQIILNQEIITIWESLTPLGRNEFFLF